MIRWLSGRLQDHANLSAGDLMALDAAHVFFDRTAEPEPETVPDVSVAAKRASRAPPPDAAIDEPAIGDGVIVAPAQRCTGYYDNGHMVTSCGHTKAEGCPDRMGGE